MRTAWLVAALLFLLVSPLLGGESIPWRDLLDPSSAGFQIVFHLRLPRLVGAAVAGAGLAVLGGSYQILFQNPLAEPYLLGVSNAFILCASVAEIVFHFAPQSWGSLGAGLAGATLATGLIIALYQMRAATEGVGVLALFGMGLQFVLSSALFLIITFHYQSYSAGGMRWLFGQIPWLSLREAAWFAGLGAPFLAALVIGARKLEAFSLGDSIARTLGVHPERERTLWLLLTSLFLSLLVSFTGAIGFVGLVVPHGVRRVFAPSSTRSLFGLSLIVGAVFLVFADVLSRSLFPPFEFPVGIFTTLLGGPLFLYLLWRSR